MLVLVSIAGLLAAVSPMSDGFPVGIDQDDGVPNPAPPPVNSPISSPVLSVPVYLPTGGKVAPERINSRPPGCPLSPPRSPSGALRKRSE
jgi:hypothetical protein